MPSPQVHSSLALTQPLRAAVAVTSSASGISGVAWSEPLVLTVAPPLVALKGTVTASGGVLSSWSSEHMSTLVSLTGLSWLGVRLNPQPNALASRQCVHVPDRHRRAVPTRDRSDRRKRLEKRAPVFGQWPPGLLLLLPDHDHHRVAGLAVDEIERAREARLLVQCGDHLLVDDVVHRRPLLLRGAALDHLCVHVVSPDARSFRGESPDPGDLLVEPARVSGCG